MSIYKGEGCKELKGGRKKRGKERNWRLFTSLSCSSPKGGEHGNSSFYQQWFLFCR